MNQQQTKKAELIRPHFTEAEAKASVEKKKKLSFRRKELEWISSIPLYLPFYLVYVEMELKNPKLSGHVKKVYTVMVNGLTNRGLTVKGNLETDVVEARGIYLDTEVTADDVGETGRLEALAGSKRMINPPPHRVLKNTRLIYYPFALVRLKVNGQEEIQMFDYYRGGLDRYMMRYLKLKEKMEEKRATI